VREQTLSESFALELMREGKLLLRMHTVNGMRWFIVPGGQVAESVVKRLLARPDVQPYDSGLFPGADLPPPRKRTRNSNLTEHARNGGRR